MTPLSPLAALVFDLDAEDELPGWPPSQLVHRSTGQPFTEAEAALFTSATPEELHAAALEVRDSTTGARAVAGRLRRGQDQGGTAWPEDGLRGITATMTTMSLPVFSCGSCGTRTHGYLVHPSLGQPEVIQAALRGMEQHPLGRELPLYFIATAKADEEMDTSTPAQVWDVAVGQVKTEGPIGDCLNTLATGLLCLCQAGGDGRTP